MFPIKNKKRNNNKNMRPGSGKLRGIINSLLNNNKLKNNISSNNNNYF